MVIRSPLVLVDGRPTQLPSGDAIVGAFGRQALMRPAAGLYVPNSSAGIAVGTIAQVAGRNTAAPYVSAFDLTVDQLGVNVTTVAAGSFAKIVIYAADANGRPSTVLLETSDISCGTTGSFFATLGTAFTFKAGVLYWIAVRASAAQTLRALGAGSLPVLSMIATGTPSHVVSLSKSETYANAAATWVYASSDHTGNLAMPLVLMRVA